MRPQPKPSQKEATLALADLLPAKTGADADADLPPSPLSALIRPLWVPTSLTIFHQETRCSHCHTTYRSATPRITLTEQHTKRPDKLRHTTHPAEIPANLPLRIEVIREPSIPYCVSCVGGLTGPELHHFLREQSMADERCKTNAKLDRQAQASARNGGERRTSITDELELVEEPEAEGPLADLIQEQAL